MQCFPPRGELPARRGEKITNPRRAVQAIEECLQEMEQNDLIKRYEVNGRKYLQIQRWQQPDGVSRYPTQKECNGYFDKNVWQYLLDLRKAYPELNAITKEQIYRLLRTYPFADPYRAIDETARMLLASGGRSNPVFVLRREFERSELTRTKKDKQSIHAMSIWDLERLEKRLKAEIAKLRDKGIPKEDERIQKKRRSLRRIKDELLRRAEAEDDLR
ncbi:MAG: hypothetical protein DRH04_01930 [Deltaproteobacteria bacterium]|nr:MAG: hypothetical protein DRH04_01930 [Deltaproteobacteria bacterium]